MGNKLSRKREAPASSPETVAADQKTEKEPAAAVSQTPEVAETESLDVVVGEPVTPVVRLPSEECVSECKATESPAAPTPQNDAEPSSMAKESPAPVQPEPQVSASKPSPSEPVAEAQLAPVPEPASVTSPEADTEIVQPISESQPEPAPAEHLEQETNLLPQESLPEPVLSSPPLAELDVTPSPASIPVPVNPDEPSNPPASEKCQDSDEAADSFTFEPEKSAERQLEKPIEVEAEECLEKLESDVNEDRVSEILKNLELKENDVVSDLIANDVNIPEDTPITDMSTSNELM